MSETTRSRCLEPFFTTKGERGTGLGLPSVFGMVQRHGGDFEIDSSGRGTTMRMIFPRAFGTAASEQHSCLRHGRCACCSSMTIRCCSARCATRSSSMNTKWSPPTAARQASTFARREVGPQFDAVITDLGMPYVDGRKVAARVRSCRAIPIIMLTGWGHRLIASADQPEHVDRVLSKPPKMAEIRGALTELVASPTRLVSQGGRDEVASAE